MKREKYLYELEEEHLTIKNLFNGLEDVIEKGKAGEIKDLRGRLEKLKKALVNHVHSEDEVFYKDLREKAVETHQEALIPALDFFIESMHKITGDADRFFEEYRDEKRILENNGKFAARLKNLRDEIIHRIDSEEGSLFYIYKAYFFDRGR
ncbi:MAG: hemerythrin domain-containing protein [Deltaproteobacteria bacterium]|nr:hemerythrin domain-containing protein [Deltaproteobacteria bacterium]